MDSVSSKEMAIAAIDNDTATASLVANEHGHLTLLQSLKKWRRVSLYCLGMTTGILMYGYDYVIVGTTAAMPSFQCVHRDDKPLKATNRNPGMILVLNSMENGLFLLCGSVSGTLLARAPL